MHTKTKFVQLMQILQGTSKKGAHMKQGNEKRDLLIETAEKLFSKFGFEKTLMEDVAKMAKMARRSVYNHFPKKDDLILAVAQKEISAIESELQAVFDSQTKSPLERLKEYLIRRMELIEQATSYKQYLQDDLHPVLLPSKTALHNTCKQFEQWEYEHLLHLLDSVPDNNMIAAHLDKTAFADMLQMTMHSLSTSFFVKEKYPEYRKTYTLLINTIIDSILNSTSNQENTTKQ